MNRLLAIAAILAVFAGPIVAQEHANKSDSEALFREFLENEARELTIEDTASLTIKELVDVIMKVQITELLELEKVEAKVLFDKMGAHLDKIHNLKWERGALHFYLREDLKIGADEDDIERKLGSAMAVEVKIAQLLEAMVKQTDECLTAEQQAKLFFYTFDFENDIKRMIMQAEELAAQKHGPTGGKYTPIDPQSAPKPSAAETTQDASTEKPKRP